jgi:hypothetical protein
MNVLTRLSFENYPNPEKNMLVSVLSVFSLCKEQKSKPGANPSIAIYNASVVNFYNARPSVVNPILRFFCAVITTLAL